VIPVYRLCSFPIMPVFPNDQRRLFCLIVGVWIFVKKILFTPTYEHKYYLAERLRQSKNSTTEL